MSKFQFFKSSRKINEIKSHVEFESNICSSNRISKGAQIAILNPNRDWDLRITKLVVSQQS